MPSGAIMKVDPCFGLLCNDFENLFRARGPLLSASQTVLPGSRGGMIRGSFSLLLLRGSILHPTFCSEMGS
jgi:hypothetical protein